MQSPAIDAAAVRRTDASLYCWAVLLLLLSFTVLAKTSPEPSAKPTSALYEDGLSRMNSGEHDAAIIQFKNVLQKEPNHLPARIALGQANLHLGNAAGAEKELRIALILGAASDEVFPTLGNALLAQRKYIEILDIIKVRDRPRAGGFDIALLRGRAHFELGQHEEAVLEFTAAGEAAPERAEPLIGLAQIYLAQSKFDEALGLVARALDLAPNDTEVWFRRGEILRQMGDDTGALAAYDKALEIKPKALRVRLARASLRLQYGQLKTALEDALFVREANEGNISAAFLLWRIYEEDGQKQAAKVALAEVTGKLNQYTDDAINNEPLLLRMAALVRYAKRDLVRTEQYLARYVALRPNDGGMRRLHGQVQLLLGEAKTAIQSLYPLYKQDPKNREVLLSLGQAYLQIGQYSEAETMFKAAQTLTPGDTSLTAPLALSQIGLGSMDEALSGLKEASEQAQGGDGAAMLLTVLQFKDGKREEALKTVSDLAERSSRNPKVLNLFGVMRMAVGDVTAARVTFEQAVRLAPDYIPPIYNLAKLDLSSGDVKAATDRLEAAVARNPRSDAALLALADIALAQDDKEGAARWLDKAVTATPDAVNAQARLVELRLSLKQINEAMTAARRMVDMNPENALAVETLARVQTVQGKMPQAIKNFRDAARYASFDGAQLMRIAQQQIVLEDFAEARTTLLKASNSAVAEEALVALIRLEIRLDDFESATNRIAELRGNKKLDPLADILTAEWHMRRTEPKEAIKAYRDAQAKAPSTVAVLGLADALVAEGDFATAIAELEGWLATYPNDVEVTRKLALIYLPAQQLDKAQALYERLLQQEPDDPLALSNLARLYQLKGDKRARELAEKAVKGAPNSPTTLDTLGWILVTEGETEKGLEYLREAISRESNPLIRYHLAQALTELGRMDEAKRELKVIIKAGQPAGLVAEVQRYFDSLGAGN